MVKAKRRPYYVRHLADDHSDRSLGEFEIQVLNSKGQARLVGFVGSSEMELVVEDHVVPLAVLEAARRQPKGQGDYVNKNGESVNPVTGIP